MKLRLFDFDALPDSAKIPVRVDGKSFEASQNETVLAVLLANGLRAICKTDRGQTYGAFCAMGVCYGCSVRIDGIARQRACQVLVRPGMEVETLADQPQSVDLLAPESDAKEAETS